MRSIGGVHTVAGRVDSQRVKFAVYWKTALVILLISGLVSLVIRFAAQKLIENHNVFSEYADILPGEPEEMIEKRGFNCGNNSNKTNYYSSDYAVCTLLPESKIFSKIEVRANHNRIVESHFYVLNNALRYGDLMTSMNISQQSVHPLDLFFFLDSFFVRVETLPTKLHFALRPVWKITFTDANALDVSSLFPVSPP